MGLEQGHFGMCFVSAEFAVKPMLNIMGEDGKYTVFLSDRVMVAMSNDDAGWIYVNVDGYPLYKSAKAPEIFQPGASSVPGIAEVLLQFCFFGIFDVFFQSIEGNNHCHMFSKDPNVLDRVRADAMAFINWVKGGGPQIHQMLQLRFVNNLLISHCVLKGHGHLLKHFLELCCWIRRAFLIMEGIDMCHSRKHELVENPIRQFYARAKL